MTLHLHGTRVAGCFRCDISADEVDQITWDRQAEVWRVDGKTFATLLEAENYITRGEADGE